MAVIKADVQDQFVVISNEIAQSTELSLELKGLIVAMASRPAKWKFNKAQLMKECSVGRDKLNKLFNELVNHGFLAVTQNYDELGRFKDNDYYFFSNPKQNPAFIPFTEKPYTDEPLTVNQVPINKESIKKENNINACFEIFWKNWRHCKTEIGYGSNYGVKQDAKRKWNSIKWSSTDIEELTNKMIDYMIMVYSDIAESKEQFKRSIYSNFENMYPQKFIDRAFEAATNE